MVVVCDRDSWPPGEPASRMNYQSLLINLPSAFQKSTPSQLLPSGTNWLCAGFCTHQDRWSSYNTKKWNTACGNLSKKLHLYENVR